MKTVSPIWYSSDKTVATVDQNGKVGAGENGTATVTASWNGMTVSCEVTVSYKLDDVESDKFLKYKIENNEVTITGCDSRIQGALEIPSTIAGYPVTEIGDRGFGNCAGLTSITIPDSVTSIGRYAFPYCTGLTSIKVDAGNTVYDSRNDCNAIIETETNTLILGCKNTVIPNDVISIGGDAFEDCTGLTSITIPDSVTSIGDCAFGGCTGLTSIVIPDSVTSIGWLAFSGCTCLTSITIPDSVTSIGGWAFSWCTGLTSITIPDSVTSIGKMAFDFCTGLTSVTIGNSVTSIGYNAFEYCTGLTSVTIPDSVTSIGSYAFSGCGGLTSIKVDAGNTVYDSRNDCNAIIETETNTLVLGCKNTVIPNSVTRIGGYAFEGCTGLTSITIPDSVTSIDYGAFNDASLTSVLYKGTQEEWNNIDIDVDNDALLNANIHYNFNSEHIVSLLDGKAKAGESAEMRIVTDSSVSKIKLTDEDGNTLVIDSFASNSDGTREWTYSCKMLTGIYNFDISLKLGKQWHDEDASIRMYFEPETQAVISFGSYPQSKVTDSTTISKLEAVTKNWISYGYYSGTGYLDDGNMAPSDYMKYCDITLNGNKYRAVTFSSYRPCCTGDTSSDNTYQDDNGYYINNVYYFKYEPLKWVVLDAGTGLVVCDSAIDSQAYNNYVLYSGSYYGDSAKTHYASDWEHSSLRAWLNDDFLNTAFTSSQQSRIKEVTRENKSTYSSTYDSNPTSDKITLLSYWDVLNTGYGFSSSYNTYDIARQRKSTDYAQCQGCYKSTSTSYYGNSWWWLRSPSDSNYAAGVSYEGWAYNDYSYVGVTNVGVVPALNLDQSTINNLLYFHSHELTHIAVAATCTADGEEYDYCEACDVRFNCETVPATGHSFKLASSQRGDCTTPTKETLECEHCHEQKVNVINRENHSYSFTVYEPTCTKGGYTEAHCSLCGESAMFDFVAPTGHKMTVTRSQATCSEHSHITYSCSKCSYSETVEDCDSAWAPTATRRLSPNRPVNPRAIRPIPARIADTAILPITRI